MKSTKLIAVATIVGASLALPAAATSASTDDSYQVSVSPGAAAPGGTVEVTAADASPTGACSAAPYTVTIGWTAVGGTDEEATAASGTTETDSSVDTSITVPSDAASTDASGSQVIVNVNVDCSSAPTDRQRARRTPSVTTNTGLITVTGTASTVHLSPSFAFRDRHETVTVTGCVGGPKSASFNSYTHRQSLEIDLSSYDAATNTAVGSFTVPSDSSFGPATIDVQCWQSSSAARQLMVGDEEEEEGTGTSGAGSAGGGVRHAPAPREVAKAAHPVKAQPTFTG